MADELEEPELSGSDLATALGVPKKRIYQILDEKRSITADTALRFGKFFGTGSELWLNLQKLYELEIASAQAGDALDAITPPRGSSWRVVV